MSNYRSVEEAQACILSHVARMPEERVALHESLGRVLARDIAANRNHPPYDVSAMDGFAVRHADAAADAPLAIVDDIRAGRMPRAKILPGKAARIMTGAPVPDGADTVVRVEDTEACDEHRVRILRWPEAGANIRPLGENLKQGETTLAAGTEITPGVLALLAMLKCREVPVYARPRVAILSTGDELEALEEPVDETKIPDANSHALHAQCKALGIEAKLLGIARDNPIELKARLHEGLGFDVLLASGGVSVGHHDFVRPVLESLGITMHFWRVAMRPGHPLAFGTGPEGQAVFGLPGNPVSSMVCFEQFVAPALRAMTGHARRFRRTLRARLAHDLTDRAGRTHFVRARIFRGKDGRLAAASTGAQGSGVLRSMAEANGFIVVPAEAECLRAGDEVTVQLLDGMAWQEENGV